VVDELAAVVMPQRHARGDRDLGSVHDFLRHPFGSP
jgi:hypothetical protein